MEHAGESTDAQRNAQPKDANATNVRSPTILLKFAGHKHSNQRQNTSPRVHVISDGAEQPPDDNISTLSQSYMLTHTMRR